MAPEPDSSELPHDNQQNTSSRSIELDTKSAILGDGIDRHHSHLHHDANVEKSTHDEVVYSKHKPLESPRNDVQRRRGANDPEDFSDSLNHEKGSLNRLDADEDSQPHTFSRFYAKYRMIFHIFVWLLFTGSANS